MQDLRGTQLPGFPLLVWERVETSGRIGSPSGHCGRPRANAGDGGRRQELGGESLSSTWVMASALACMGVGGAGGGRRFIVLNQRGWKSPQGPGGWEAASWAARGRGRKSCPHSLPPPFFSPPPCLSPEKDSVGGWGVRDIGKNSGLRGGRVGVLVLSQLIPYCVALNLTSPFGGLSFLVPKITKITWDIHPSRPSLRQQVLLEV